MKQTKEQKYACELISIKLENSLKELYGAKTIATNSKNKEITSLIFFCIKHIEDIVKVV